MTRLLCILFLLSACRPDGIDLSSNAREGYPLDPIDSLERYPLTTHEGEGSIHFDTLSYLALGDSYTIGEDVSSEGRWPVQLRQSINDASLAVYLDDPTIIAQTGWNTQALANAMDAANIDEERYDLVSLLIGVNNQYQGLSLEQYATQFTDLLQRAIAIADGNIDLVFVVSIPDYGYTPFGVNNQQQISTQLAAFNQTCLELTEAAGVRHYNITPISQQWPDVEGLIAPDNLHPSGYQYSLWVQSFVGDIMEQITH